MALPVYLQQFKAAGIYRVVYDKSTVEGVDAETLRLVVGYSEQGPFNIPTYVSSASDFVALYGNISRKLERRGIFFHRLALHALAAGPILCLNLKNFDGVQTSWCSIDSTLQPTIKDPVSVRDIYDTSGFWELSEDKVRELGDNDTNYIHIVASDDIKKSNTFFIRKAIPDNVRGYNVTVSDWYSDADEVPEFLQNHLDANMTDFMAEVYVFSGEFKAEQINASSTLGKYFDVSGDNVTLKPSVNNVWGKPQDTLEMLFKESTAKPVGHYIGSLIPELKDKNNNYISLNIVFNKDQNVHNMIMSFNTELLYNNVDGEDNNNIIKIVNQAIFNTTKWKVNDVVNTYPTLVNIYNASLDGAYKGGDQLDETKAIKYNEALKLTPLTSGGQFSQETAKKYNDALGLKQINVQSSISQEIADLYNKYILSTGQEASKLKIAGDEITEAEANAYNEYIGIKKADDPITETDANKYNKAIGYKKANDTITTVEANKYNATLTNAIKKTTNNDPLTEIQANRLNTLCTLNYYTLTQPTYLEGYDYSQSKYFKPAGTGVTDKLKWHNDIISVLNTETGLRKGLLNKSYIDYRYIIDTFEAYPESQATFGSTGNSSTKSKLANLAQQKQSAFAILNFPAMRQFVKKEIEDVEGIVDGGYVLPTEAEGASYCAFYTPLKFTDGYIDTIVPAAGLVSNLFMNKYTSRQPYYIIAGPNYGLISTANLVGPDYNYSNDELQIIEPFGVNCMVYRPGFGTFINANQTAKQVPVSALSKVHVRELVIYLQDQIEKVLQSYQWEFNNATTRNAILDKANQICARVAANGGIQAYLNVMDESNNTPDVIDNEMAILSTHIEPGRGCGKMVQELTIYRTGELSATISD